MADQKRTDLRSAIGRRETDFELPALRLQYADLMKLVTEMRLRLHRAELKIDELDLILEKLL